MTKLEMLCGGLRAIKQPVAAQILEDRTDDEWRAMREATDMDIDDSEDPNPLLGEAREEESSATASMILLCSVSWAYDQHVVDWDELHSQLLAWESNQHPGV
jgi:hypothetical protein